MKSLLALLPALLLLHPAPADDAPDCRVTLTLPHSALDLQLEYRQMGPDLAPFREPAGADAAALRKLRVLSHLSLGASLRTDVWLKVGERAVRPGRHPLGFTIGDGDAVHLFLVDGDEAFALPGEALEPGWESPRIVLQLQYVSRDEAQLLWHWRKGAGSIRLALGTPDAPTPAER